MRIHGTESDGRRDEQGRRICRWCDGLVPPPKKTFCSEHCIHEWKLRTQPEYRRPYILDRTKGVCEICGTNTFELQERLQYLTAQATNDFGQPWHQSGPVWPIGFGAVLHEAASHGVSLAKTFVLLRRKHPYDVDHIVPLVEGGGHGLDNLRLLCIGCHESVTTALHKRRAKKKKRK